VLWIAWHSSPSNPLDSVLSNRPSGLDVISSPTLESAAQEDASRSSFTPVVVDQDSRRSVELGAIDLEGALWIEGAVLFSSRTPQDDRTVVYATREALDADALGLGSDLDEERAVPFSRTVVDESGHFRIPIPKELESVHLSVQGNYTFSRRSLGVKLPAGSEVELQAELGAWVVGVVEPSAATNEATKDGLEARLVIDPRDATNMFDGSAWQVRSVQAKDWNFEFTGVAIENPLRVFALSEELSAMTSDRIKLEAGQKYELRLSAIPGGTIRGRVVDRETQPMADVLVYVLDDANFLSGRPGRRVRETQTAEDGTFELLSVAPGALSVRAELPKHLEVSKRVDLKTGETVSGVELVLTTGLQISGRTLGPDGKVLGDVEVTAIFDLGVIGGLDGLYSIRGNYQQATSSADGSFELSGLGRGPFSVTAEWLPLELETEGLTGNKRARNSFSARADRVKPSKEGIELRLSAPIAIEGSVLLADGSRAGEFRVCATRRLESLVSTMGNEILLREFSEAEGKFELWGIRPGTWEVVVSAPGHAPSAALQVSVSEGTQGKALEFQLRPEIVIAGKVILPDGQPAKGAQVSVSSNAFDRMSEAFHADASTGSVSGDQGGFELGGLQAGTVSLVASLDGYSDSLEAVIDLEDGLATEPVVLDLRVASSIRGVVFSAGGALAVGDAVIARIPAELNMLQTSTGNDGRFEFLDLPPGSWQVMALPNEDQVAEILADEEANVSSLLTGLRMKMVKLQEGDDLEIQLGESMAEPVRVFGRVTLDDEPTPGAVVSFLAESSDNNSIRIGTTDREGRFDLNLPATGSYLMLIQRMGQVMAETSIESRVTIPDGAEHEVDVELPLGQVTGKVLGPEGESLVGARVTLVGSGSESRSFWGGQLTDTLTDSKGNYKIDWLRAGTYRITAGGEQFGGVFGEPSPWGRQLGRRLVLTEGEHQAHVDFRLKLGGGVRGIVRNQTGSAVPDAAIFVYDSEGHRVERLSFIQSDSAGAYEVRSLAAGEYSLLARAAELASEPSERVLVASGSVTELDLGLAESTWLDIEVRGANNASTEAMVHVFDSEGREQSGMFSLNQLLGTLQSGSTKDLQRIGPLAPGRYELKASLAGVGSAQKKITLRGRESRTVVLRLK
jgi:hypothetical protein